MWSIVHADSKQWPISGQAFVALFGLFGSTLIARSLGPEDFGKFFLALTVVSVVSIFCDLCVGQAILTRADGYIEHTATWKKVSVATASCASLLCFSIGTVFFSDAAELLMWGLLCAVVPLTAFAAPPRAFLVLSRNLRLVSVIDVVSVLLANVLAVLIVLAVPSVWVAALGQLLVALLRAGAFEIAGRRCSKAYVQLETKFFGLRLGLRTLWASTSGIYQSQLSGFLARNGDNLVISATLGPVALAQYSRAYSFLVGPLQQAQIALTPLTLRDMAEARALGGDERETVRAASWLLGLMIPASGALVVLGPALINVLLGPAWHEAGALVALSAGLAVSMTLALPARWYLMASRHRKLLGIDSLLQFSILGGCFIGCLYWGVFGAMSVNAFIVGPLVAIIEWMLLPKFLLRSFFIQLVPLAAVLFAIPAMSAVLLQSAIHAEVVEVVGGLTIASVVSVASLLVHRWLNKNASRGRHVRRPASKNIFSL